MENCTQGHPILEDQNVCAQGHPIAPSAAQGANAPPDPVAMMLQTQQMMQATMQQLLQNLALTAPAAPNPTPGGRVKRPDRPIIDADATDSDWAMFINSWERYKTMTKISDPVEIRNELRSTCSSVINKLLFDFVGASTLNTCSEQQLLSHIKSVAVKGVHKEVHRQKFHSLHQSPGEPITRYLARLRAQVALCEFRVTCSAGECAAPVSYAEDMIAGQMIAGLANIEHQSKILAEATTLVSLQAKYDRLISLETTDQSTSHLHAAPPKPMIPSESAAQKSQYAQQKRSKKEGRALVPCKGCGETYHPPGKSMARKDCPAFGTVCRNCGIRGHLQRVCRQPKAPKQPESGSNAARSDPASTEESYIFAAQLSSTSTKSDRKCKHRQQQHQ